MAAQCEIAIIGAGPYGLSIAAFLRGSGLSFRIFGTPMQSWSERMPKGMLLKSEGFASSLYDPESAFTLAVYCKEKGIPYEDVGLSVTRETFVAYGLEFQKRFVPTLEQTDIQSVERTEDGFVLTTANGEKVVARRVILATGITHYPFLPPSISGLPPELVSHSFDHHDLSRFKDRRVAVLGGGASAVDMAALLHEAGAAVELIARRDAIAFHEPQTEPRPLSQRLMAPRSGLGLGWRSRMSTDAPLLFHRLPRKVRLRAVQRHLGPAPGWFMRERVLGVFPLHLSSRITSAAADGDQVVLQLERNDPERNGPERNGGGEKSQLRFDHVISATGFQVDLSRLQFLTSLAAQVKCFAGTPVLSRSFESSVPGLYFVGLASANSFGPLTRFAFGAGFTAKRIAQHLNAQFKGRRSSSVERERIAQLQDSVEAR